MIREEDLEGDGDGDLTVGRMMMSLKEQSGEEEHIKRSQDTNTELFGDNRRSRRSSRWLNGSRVDDKLLLEGNIFPFQVDDDEENWREMDNWRERREKERRRRQSREGEENAKDNNNTQKKGKGKGKGRETAPDFSSFPSFPINSIQAALLCSSRRWCLLATLCLFVRPLGFLHRVSVGLAEKGKAKVNELPLSKQRKTSVVVHSFICFGVGWLDKHRPLPFVALDPGRPCAGVKAKRYKNMIACRPC